MLVSRLRTATTIGKAVFADRSTISRLECVVRWLDCDLNMHMTNARYLQYMDQGRSDLFVRSGTWRLFPTYRPMIVQLNLSFRRELKPKQPFVLDSRMVGFSGKAITTEQHFLVDGDVYARAQLSSLLLHKGRVVAAPDVQGLQAHFAEPLPVA